jgi:hypothetical protein
MKTDSSGLSSHTLVQNSFMKVRIDDVFSRDWG